MALVQPDEGSKEERLKAALWYSVGQTIDAVALKQDINATPHFIGGLGEMLWGQIENVTRDLEAFARHAGRSTINTQDVMLLGRRNEGVQDVLQCHAKTVRGTD